MLLPPLPLIYRRRARRSVRRKPPAPPGPAALVLVSAVYTSGDPSWVTLVFDRAIDLSGLNGAAIVVNDAVETFTRWDATGVVSLLNPVTVEFTLFPIFFGPSGPLRMDASAANGIVAAGDGGAWAGVTNLLLPFP